MDDTAALIWRDYETDGVPASGARKPYKPDIRAWGTGIETFLDTVKEKLTAPRTYYVRSDGNDGNSGLTDTSGGAFLTLQGAWNTLCNTVDSCGFLITIKIGAGTYDGVSDVSRPYDYGQVYFVGDIAAPSTVVIDQTAATDDCFLFGQSNVIVAGMKLKSQGSCVHAAFNGKISIGDGIVFDSAVEYHIFCDNQGKIGTATTAYTITGSAAGHFYVHSTGWLGVAGVTITLTGTPAFSTAFAIATQSGFLEAPGLTFSGGCTGRRYIIEQGGNISTGNTGNTSYFPGSVAGYNLAGFYDNTGALGGVVSFTPQYGGSVTLGTTTQSVSATYLKMGALVHVTIRLVWTANSGSTGNACISGLPFNAAYDSTLAIWHSGLTGTAGRNITTFVSGGTNKIIFQACDPAGGGPSSVALEAAGDVLITGTYLTSA